MSMRTTLLLVAMCLSGCGIPIEAIRPDGILTIEIVARGSFRVGDHMYSEDMLGFALRRLKGASGFRAVEMLIPSSLIDKKNVFQSCGQLAQVLYNTEKEWRFFEWTPRDIATKRPIQCDVLIVA